MPKFPAYRPRRLRRTEPIRSLVRETAVHPSDLILPLFVVEGTGVRRAIGSMPGVEQTSEDELLRDAREAAGLGIGGVLLFGIPAHKDPEGTAGYDEDGVVQRAVRRLKAELPELVVITDVCLCEYTSHGHCGILDGRGSVDNDRTLEVYAKAAVAQATAGAHVCAPSGMMDGPVGVIRAALDGAGHTNTAILAYSAKYASGLYGPFRDAVDVQIIGGGDRKGYQQDWRNSREALVEVAADIEQGADMVRVKPALAYLDVISAVRSVVDVPVAAYHVSGEYAMIKAAAANGWIDHDAVAIEQLTAIKRAGADIILTYLARWFAESARR